LIGFPFTLLIGSCPNGVWCTSPKAALKSSSFTAPFYFFKP
jgi:hypothetical protein